MKEFKYIWLFGLVATFLLIAVPIALFVPGEASAIDDPWAGVPERVPDVGHADIIQGPFSTGQEVTAACLQCHEDAGQQMLQNVHWTWESEPVMLPGRDEPVTIGKRNQINNFCIGIQGNWEGCTRCHSGYGWSDANFDFGDVESIDCLVCHEQTGTYVKSNAGLPSSDVDLLAVAQSVGTPTRNNCGGCHFNGGGGNGVKHGDLDASLHYPTEEIDVHMGGNGLQCVDCHRSQNHDMLGRAMFVSTVSRNEVQCTQCHAATPHADERINDHLSAVACQTCHIPEGAVRDATKMSWDWSTAGQDLPEDPHTYLKIKGSFIYEANFVPTYTWYNGNSDRYILGDVIDPEQTTLINRPLGDIDDPAALIWPFKIHQAVQIYDSVFNYLLQPKTVGDGGYWTEFNWDQAARLGAEAAGLEYSGQYGWASTAMYSPLSHMVAPKEYALQCVQCHGESGRMDWEALGYPGDPLEWGGRQQSVVGEN
jgi:octaheme c-type cytochrome (tetrathionate reductase family)